MTTLAFDTHQAVKALTAAGADETLAEAVVSTIGDAVSGNVATKTDLAKVEAGLKGDIAAVKAELTEVKAELTEVKAELKGDIAAVKAGMAGIRAELKTDLGDLEARLHRHLWAMAAGIVGLTVALVRLTA